MLDPEAGYLTRDGIVLVVEVLECCPWFEFADLDVYASDDEAGTVSLSTETSEDLNSER